MKIYHDDDCRLLNSSFASCFHGISCSWVVWGQEEYTYTAELALCLKLMGEVYFVINDKIFNDAGINERIKDFKGSFGYHALLLLNKKKARSIKVSREPYNYYIESCKYDCETDSEVAAYLKLVRFGSANGILLSADVDLKYFIGVLGSIFSGNRIEPFCLSELVNGIVFALPLTFHSDYKGLIFFGKVQLDSGGMDLIRGVDEFRSRFGAHVWGLNKLSILKEMVILLA